MASEDAKPGGDAPADAAAAAGLAALARARGVVKVQWPAEGVPLRSAAAFAVPAPAAPPMIADEVAECVSNPRAAVAAAARAAALATVRALHAHVDVDAVRVERLEAGVVNQTFRVAAERTGAGSEPAPALVVRLRGVGDGLEWAMREYVKEAACAAAAMRAALPVAAPLGLGVVASGLAALEAATDGAGQLFAFSVQAAVPGEPAWRALRDGRAVDVDVWTALGAFAKALRAVPARGFGDHLDVEALCRGDGDNDAVVFTRAPSEAGLFEYIDYNLGELSKGDDDPLRRRRVLCEADAAVARAAVEGLRRRVEAGAFEFGLCHGDLHPRNALLAPDAAGTLQLSGVVDWGCAEVAPAPHATLVMLHDWSMYEGGTPDAASLAAAAAALGVAAPEGGEVMRDVRALQLLRAMDKCRWAVDRSIDSLAELAEHLSSVLQRFFGGEGMAADAVLT